MGFLYISSDYVFGFPKRLTETFVAKVVGGCRLESSDLNTAQAKEGPAAWLEHSVHFPVLGVGQELALELPRTTAKVQVCIFFAG